MNGPQIFEPVIFTGPKENLRIDASARVDSFCKIEIGKGVYLGPFVHIASYCHLNIGGGELEMHEGSAAGSGVKIVTGSNLPGYLQSCSAIAPSAKFAKKRVVIHKNAVLFVGAIVLPGVVIGENAVIAAGAVVRCDVPAFEIWAGVPAKKVGRIASPAKLQPTLEDWPDRILDY